MSKVFSEKLKKIMFEKNLTQDVFAKKLGVNQSHISNWITGRRNPSVKTLNKIAKELDIPVSSLLTENKNDDKNNDNAIKQLEEKIKNIEIKFLKFEKNYGIKLLQLENEFLKSRK